MKKRQFILFALAAPASALLAAACGEAPKATPTGVPAPAAQPTAIPMADKLVLYGDMVLFGGSDNPDTCTGRTRFKRGESVGFRMTAIYPLSGQVADTAELTVKLANGDTVSMNFRGTGPNPHPGMWTGKWVVPASAPLGIMRYTVEAKDKEERTGTFAPFNVDASQLTIVA
jgi:hypothetical protein